MVATDIRIRKFTVLCVCHMFGVLKSSAFEMTVLRDDSIVSTGCVRHCRRGRDVFGSLDEKWRPVQINSGFQTVGRTGSVDGCNKAGYRFGACVFMTADSSRAFVRTRGPSLKAVNLLVRVLGGGWDLLQLFSVQIDLQTESFQVLFVAGVTNMPFDSIES